MGRITVTKPTDDDLKELGVTNWPIWSCDVSRFDWSYDRKETCYLLQGRATVTAGNERVSFEPGDLVVFPQGLTCTWDVTAPVKKHYKFG